MKKDSQKYRATVKKEKADTHESSMLRPARLRFFFYVLKRVQTALIDDNVSLLIFM